MKKLRLNASLLLCAAILAACSGGSTEYVDYPKPPDNTPKLDMKAAVYQAVLPSGNILTLTTDQFSGTAVYGAYTIKNNDGTLVSSGVVSESVSQLKLIGHKRKFCSDEALLVSVDSTTVNASSDEAYITISGDKICSGTLPITTPMLIKRPTTATMYSRGTIGANQELALEVISADNINFVGTLTLNNTSLPVLAKGTVIGTTTTQDSTGDSAADPDVGQVVAINDPLAYGFLFNRVTNFSGHFFYADDSITKITGKVRTTPTAPFYMNEIRVTADDNFTTQPEMLLSNPTVRLDYNPL